ncbi:hypothetical protein RF11_06884 [Thelohanellus kitauei]|uniref:Secreted protein n=1 Tax=Thelohanellus kitauei TaxID=669202 RepID=A0A0C2IZM1_THEKT|nr:hypothetical protein RF11_06884 [Thelohanellus kitauei]
MLCVVLLFTGIPLVMGYHASKHDIEACYRIIKPGHTVLIGFRFPAFHSVYPPAIYMTIEREYREISSRNRLKDIFKFQLIFHSTKCNRTFEISQTGNYQTYSVYFRF